ncbi:MAG: GNAT family N-acetyltransferase [Pseudomonadota bacterium]
MTTAEELAARHAAAFQDDMRPWSAEEFETLLTSPHVHLIEADNAFALIRMIVDEAEILTLATDPAHRRKGFARTLLTLSEDMALTQGVKTIFLDVAASNTAARALYEGAGFQEKGRRKAYYQTPDGRIDALLLVKSL